MTETTTQRHVLTDTRVTDGYLTDHQLFLLGRAIHRVALLEQFIENWIDLLLVAAGKQTQPGSKASLVSSLTNALKNAPEEYRNFDVEEFTTTLQDLLNARHFLAHGIAVTDSEGDLVLRKEIPASIVKKSESSIAVEVLIVNDQNLEMIYEQAVGLDVAVAEQRQYFKPPEERPFAVGAHPITGRIMTLSKPVLRQA